MIRKLLLLSLLALMNSTGYGQLPPDPPPKGMLTIPEWKGRRAALDQALAHYPLSDPAMQNAIAQLLNREENDPEWQERDELLSFEQYEQKLFELNQKIALTYNKDAAWRALVYTNYNSTSSWGLWLIQQPQAVKLILNMLQDSNQRIRGRAAELLAESIQSCTNTSGSAACLIDKSQQEHILSSLHQRILSGPGGQISFELIALGICGTERDVAFLDDVIRQQKAKMVTPEDQKPDSHQNMIIWFCKDSQAKIKQRLASGQPK